MGHFAAAYARAVDLFLDPPPEVRIVGDPAQPATANRWVGEGLAQASPPWRCSRCGKEEAGAFRRNGSYRRRLSTLAGVITLQVPKLRCLCGAHVSLRFPVLEPRRRHWWDV